jgi:pimeloyl-ACP methyl ester carboxylesterase
MNFRHTFIVIFAFVGALSVPGFAADAWTDPSGHRASFVAVAADIKIEVLDWGGRGPTLLLLAGGGNTAHVFDYFAHQFTDRFRVLGLTRRGYGASSHPLSGYDLDTLVQDIVAVLDHLKVDQVTLVGHSRAGAELTRLAAVHPHRVSALVYLDAAIDRSNPPKTAAPDRAPSDSDWASVERFNAWIARTRGMRYPEAEIRATREVDADGRVRGPTTPADLNARISEGINVRPDYGNVRAPALAIYSPATVRGTPTTPHWTHVQRISQIGDPLKLRSQRRPRLNNSAPRSNAAGLSN